MKETVNLIERKELGKAIVRLESILFSRPELHMTERLAEIRNDYDLMTLYWRQGYKDPERAQVYEKLLRRLLTLTTDLLIKEKTVKNPIFSNISQRLDNSQQDWSVASIRSQLENDVSTMAMLQLEPEHIRKTKEDKLLAEHRRFVDNVFENLLVSGTWTGQVANAYTELLVSPTIDVIDQQLLVSAVSLSAINHFDPHKFVVLTDVYQKATDERVRQRALVGWGLCLGSFPSAMSFPEVGETIRKIASNDQWREELTELQLQLIYCMNAENDTKKIHDEIMPELLKNNNFRITRNGIEEVEEDPMEDILNSDSSERKMEVLEANMQKMVDMQRSGADIYFGGFAQMKRHPFFSQISNWFMPFYSQHPSVRNIWNGAQGKRFLHRLLATGSFCDSDKYSFILAFEKVVELMPQKLREVFESGEAQLIGGEVEAGEKQTAAYIRRMYLQDMYRFYRLYPSRNLFVNPFNDQSEARNLRLLFANRLLALQSLGSCFNEVAAFLLKRKLFAEALAVLENYPDEAKDYRYYLMYGSVLMQTGKSTTTEGSTATDLFRKALQLQPDNERALAGFARASFSDHNYQEALDAYDRLLLLHENHKTYLLNKSVCLVNLECHEDAQKILYRLDYEHPEDKNVKRVLAWSMVCHGQQEQAGKIYEQLLAQEKVEPEDCLNDGLRLWILGAISEAAKRFRQVRLLKNAQFDAEQEFMVEARDLLEHNGISDVEIRLMIEELGN